MLPVRDEKAKALLEKKGAIKCVFEMLNSYEFGVFTTACAECDTAEDKVLDAENAFRKTVATLKSRVDNSRVTDSFYDEMERLTECMFELEREAENHGFEKAVRTSAVSELHKHCIEEVNSCDYAEATLNGDDVFNVIIFLSDKFALVDPFEL